MLKRGEGQGHHKQSIGGEKKKKKRMVLSRSLSMGDRSSQGLKLIHLFFKF